MLLSALLVAVVVLAGMVLLVRPALMNRSRLEADSASPRVTAEVRSGQEQVAVHVARSLRVPIGSDQVGYGEIYVVSSTDDRITLASRSEIGRGFDGEIRMHQARHGTLVEYFVLRLPGDESLHLRVLRLDRQIADALHAIDPHAEVRLVTQQQRQDDRGRGRMPPQLPAG